MKTIALANGRGIVLVDDEDHAAMSLHKWHRCTRYAGTMINGERHVMHRLLLKPTGNLLVDHADGNGLNNQRSNLRLCTYSQNLVNKNWKRPGYIGVWKQPSGKYRASVGGCINVGLFATAEEAARARDVAALKKYGKFARLNFPL